MKVYPKNTFDRFGDDLTELILQYLTFEDKIRLECVSKQWRRLIYNKQFVIVIDFKRYETQNPLNRLLVDEKQSTEEILESLLKKCPNIENVIIDKRVNSKVLSLIGQYCPRLKSLTDFSKDDKDLQFFRMYGHKLEELGLFVEKEEIKQILEFCPNIKRLSIPCNSVLLTEDKQFLPKLEHILMNFYVYPRHVNKMKILSDKYRQTIKTLKIELCYLTEEELKTCIDCIARFENLTELKLRISCSDITQPIDDCLSLIGQKCTKLLNLDLVINKLVPISDKFLKIFSEFKAIKKLKITLWHKTVLSGSVECFKHCKQLNDIDISYPELTEDFFTNIKIFVPELKSLDIKTDKQYSDSFIHSFNSMKNIQKVELLTRIKTKLIIIRDCD